MPRKKTYAVNITQTVIRQATVYVDAPSRKAAEEAAPMVASITGEWQCYVTKQSTLSEEQLP
jgi:hypothetical protein